MELYVFIVRRVIKQRNNIASYFYQIEVWVRPTLHIAYDTQCDVLTNMLQIMDNIQSA
jgi:hypothetical protein